MQHEHRPDVAAAGAGSFVCPRCGGPIWERGDGASTSFECRIGDRFSEAEMWIAHSVARNEALLAAARALADNAAQARRIAASAAQRGDAVVTARLELEAHEDDRLYAQVRAMIEDLPESDPNPRS